MVLPLCLVPTLKEGSGSALAGCVGTLVADTISVAVIVYGMRGHPSIPDTEVSFSQVANTFGNLALSFGAGVIIPDLQRQHSEPQRMPRVITVTMGIISIMMILLAVVPYTSAGCQISGNILYTIYPDPSTRLTLLGFKPNWGAVVLTYLAMQLHITTAFAVLLNPAFYMAEFVVLGMHKHDKPSDVENGMQYLESANPTEDFVKQTDSSTTKMKCNCNCREEEDQEAAEYRGANAIRYVVLRICITLILVIVSILFQDHFSDFANFVGSSSLTMSCILLPVAFYLIKAWNDIFIGEKFAALVVLVVCFVFGCYSTYTAGKNLFFPPDSDALFPYCEPEYQNTVFYNYTAVHNV
ncbi:amino acid auxin permease family [Plasmopara halstedii]|uniref:Amino acid auxin permease family n=1 Tax=Plasmopara halstedii TaxID=4781 RepID=A0A0P1AQ83_PLAHL|nr:amino acid auxin permease family [Plasmopara halstedii]CEG43272.1 amino acid auxin permease family [Plasmopara halstedii]|eukprot:XP_024579641.1 amino acid auxin permease family [Plasmopara halstedii]